MDLKVREAARLLGVSDDTIYRWIRNGMLPARKVHEQYRFNRVELQEWAAKHNVRVDADLYTNPHLPTGEPVALADALALGGIHRGVAGRTRDEVLARVVELPGVPAGVDRKLLLTLLMRREALSSTGIGNGIALPHPRNPLVLHLDQPRVLLCLLEHAVDFGAIDNQPVGVLFILLTPHIRAHLSLLSKIAFALHDAELRRLLDQRASDDAILARLRAIEAQAPKR